MFLGGWYYEYRYKCLTNFFKIFILLFFLLIFSKAKDVDNMDYIKRVLLDNYIGSEEL